MKALKSPRVNAYDESVCLYDDGVNHWCLDHFTFVEAGWEWEQRYAPYPNSFTPDYFYYRLRPK